MTDCICDSGYVHAGDGSCDRVCAAGFEANAEKACAWGVTIHIINHLPATNLALDVQQTHHTASTIKQILQPVYANTALFLILGNSTMRRWPGTAEPETLHTAHLKLCTPVPETLHTGSAVPGQRSLARITFQSASEVASGALFLVQLQANSIYLFITGGMVVERKPCVLGEKE